jgi:hypothetical protein
VPKSSNNSSFEATSTRSEAPAPTGHPGWTKRGAGWKPPRPSPWTTPAKHSWPNKDYDPTQAGEHLAVSDAMRAQFGGPLSGLGALRRRRNELEYPAFPGEHVDIDEVTAAITTAQNLLDTAHHLIGHLGLFT